VGREPLHIESLHPHLGEEHGEGGEMEIGKVLVVDGVVFDVIQQVEQIRHLRDEHTVLVEQRVKRPSHGWKIVDVREDVVANDHLRRPTLRA